MSDVKNFGLIGIGSTVQWSKSGPRIKQTAGTFNLRNSSDTGDAALTTAGITSSTGNVTLSTGNLIASTGNLLLPSSSASFVIGTDTTLNRQQAGVFQLVGTAAVIMPNGTVAERPVSSVAGMVRFNSDNSALEYYTGSTWLSLAVGGSVVTSFQTTLSGLSPATSTSGAITLSGTLGVPSGGTGAVTLTLNGVVYGNGISPVGITAAGTQYQILNAGTGGVPQFDAVHLDQSTAIIGTLPVSNGGTGNTTFASNNILYGNGTSAIASSADFSYDNTTKTINIGAVSSTSSIAGAVGGAIISTNVSTGYVWLIPGATGGIVKIGDGAAAIVESDIGFPLTLTGDTNVTINPTNGKVFISLSGTTTNKVTVSGPTAAQYATSLADTDLANKYYVDAAAGNVSNSVKVVSATVNLSSAGTTSIGAALPTGSTILSVKVNVTVADTATGTLSVGKSGNVAAYMTTTENDTQTTGLYMAEEIVTEAGSVQIIATVAGTPGGSGSAVVLVEYELA